MRITHAIAYAAAAALPLSIIAGVPGQAVVATATVTFNDCDVTKDLVKVGGDTRWSPSVTIDHPGTAPVDSAQTIEVVLGTLPGNTFPEDLPEDADLQVSVTFEDGTGDTFTFEGRRPLGAFDKSAPLEVGEFEADNRWYSSGVYDFRPKSVQIRLFGEPDPVNNPFEYGDYRYDCDQVVNPDPLSQIRIFDPNAPASVSVTPGAGQQGGALTVRGRDFAREATDDPDTDVTVFVGSISVGAFDVDDIGSFSGVVRIPEFAKPGAAVAVRASDAGESAVTTIGVTVRRAVLKAGKSVRSGGKLKLAGSGFKPGEKVAVKLKGGKGSGKKAFTVKITVNSAGAFTTSVKLKKAATGSWRAAATGPASFRSAKTSFKVK